MARNQQGKFREKGRGSTQSTSYSQASQQIGQKRNLIPKISNKPQQRQRYDGIMRQSPKQQWSNVSGFGRETISQDQNLQNIQKRLNQPLQSKQNQNKKDIDQDQQKKVESQTNQKQSDDNGWYNEEDDVQEFAYEKGYSKPDKFQNTNNSGNNNKNNKNYQDDNEFYEKYNGQRYGKLQGNDVQTLGKPNQQNSRLNSNPFNRNYNKDQQRNGLNKRGYNRQSHNTFNHQKQQGNQQLQGYGQYNDKDQDYNNRYNYNNTQDYDNEANQDGDYNYDEDAYNLQEGDQDFGDTGYFNARNENQDNQNYNNNGDWQNNKQYYGNNNGQNSIARKNQNNNNQRYNQQGNWYGQVQAGRGQMRSLQLSGRGRGRQTQGNTATQYTSSNGSQINLKINAKNSQQFQNDNKNTYQQANHGVFGQNQMQGRGRDRNQIRNNGFNWTPNNQNQKFRSQNFTQGNKKQNQQISQIQLVEAISAAGLQSTSGTNITVESVQQGDGQKKIIVVSSAKDKVLTVQSNRQQGMQQQVQPKKHQPEWQSKLELDREMDHYFQRDTTFAQKKLDDELEEYFKDRDK